MNERQKALIRLLKLLNSSVNISLWDYDDHKIEELKDQGLIETAVADWNHFEISLTSKGREIEIESH